MSENIYPHSLAESPGGSIRPIHLLARTLSSLGLYERQVFIGCVILMPGNAKKDLLARLRKAQLDIGEIQHRSVAKIEGQMGANELAVAIRHLRTMQTTNFMSP